MLGDIGASFEALTTPARGVLLSIIRRPFIFLITLGSVPSALPVLSIFVVAKFAVTPALELYLPLLITRHDALVPSTLPSIQVLTIIARSITTHA